MKIKYILASISFIVCILAGFSIWKNTQTQNEIIGKYNNPLLYNSSENQLFDNLSIEDFRAYKNCQNYISIGEIVFFSLSVVNFFILLIFYINNHQKFMDWIREKKGIKPEKPFQIN